MNKTMDDFPLWEIFFNIVFFDIISTIIDKRKNHLLFNSDKEGYPTWWVYLFHLIIESFIVLWFWIDEKILFDKYHKHRVQEISFWICNILFSDERMMRIFPHTILFLLYKEYEQHQKKHPCFSYSSTSEIFRHYFLILMLFYVFLPHSLYRRNERIRLF